MVYNQGGDEFTYLYAPPLVDGQGPRGASAEPTGELLVQAVMEPDVSVEGLRMERGKLRLRLSDAATLRIRIDKTQNGQFRRVRTLKRAGKEGQNALSLGRTPAAGRYRVTVVATDADGNRSAPKRIRFRLRPR
jgi:hypothetical protein